MSSNTRTGWSSTHRVPETVGVLRFAAALFFANASFFEDAALKLGRQRPGLEFIVVLAQGINLLDARAAPASTTKSAPPTSSTATKRPLRR